MDGNKEKRVAVSVSERTSLIFEVVQFFSLSISFSNLKSQVAKAKKPTAGIAFQSHFDQKKEFIYMESDKEIGGK